MIASGLALLAATTTVAGTAHAQARRYLPPPPYAANPCAPGYNPGGYGGQCICNQPVDFYPGYPGGYPGYPGGYPGGYNITLRQPGVRVYGNPVNIPTGVVTIQGAPIYVDAPPIRVASPQIYLQRPTVVVRPGKVDVEPPTVHVADCGPGQQCDYVGSSNTPTGSY